MSQLTLNYRLTMPSTTTSGAFEVGRSNMAAQAANDNSRLMAQSALLINGGAATAVIAFLTKDKIDPFILKAVPWALLFYTIGVMLGSGTLYYMTESLDRWNEFWEFYARRGDSSEREKGEKVAEETWGKAKRFFQFSIIAFAIGCGCMAYGILAQIQAQPTQRIATPQI